MLILVSITVKKGMLPAVDTEVSVDFKVRLVVKSNDGLIIGYLPTKYNYLRNCIVKGFTYTGVVSNVSTDSYQYSYS